MQDPEFSADVRIHPSATSVVRFGRFFFDRDNHILSTEEGEITLPPRVLAILDLFIERAGSVVSKETLMALVWKDACVGDTSLTEAVSLLRHALGDDPKSPSYVQTVHRRGYRFVATVAVAGRAADSRTTEPSRKPSPGPDRARQPAPGRPVIRVAMVLAGLAVVISVLFAVLPRESGLEPAGAAAIRLDVSSPQGVSLPFFTTAALALSPTGDVLVFAGRDSDGTTRLYRRRISEFDSHAIPGTEGAGSPFFSPDGSWVGFFAESELRKTPLDGGAVIRICQSSFAFGGSWTDDGKIIFAGRHPNGLSIVSADGGEVSDLTSLRVADGEIGHWWPQFLPGGHGVVYTIWSSTLATGRIAVLDLETGEERVLINGASFPRYLSNGVLLYVTPGGLASVPFDIEHLDIDGSGQVMVDQPRSNPFVGLAHFAVSNEGTLAYLPSHSTSFDHALVRIDGAGTQDPIGLENRLYRNLRVGPKGENLAVTILDGARSDVWTTPIESPILNRLTFSGFNIEPRWSPDGEWVIFASNRDGPFNIYRKPADGDGLAERLAASEFHQYPGGFTPDGRSLVYSQADPVTGSDIWIVSIDDGEGSVRPLLRTPANENFPTLSPDGRWLAYISDESGRWEVYLRSATGDGGVWQVSTGGAGEAFWSTDGSRVYYGQKNGLISVPVTFQPEPIVGQGDSFPWADDLTVIGSLPGDGDFIAIKELAEHPSIDAVRVVVYPD